MATGPLSAAMTPDFPGLDTFAGQIHHTAHWPHEGVDFTGKRVAVIGTGSSGIQSIPIIAEQADAALRLPAHPELQCPGGQPAADRRGGRRRSRPTTPSGAGCLAQRRRLAARRAPETDDGGHPQERRAAFEDAWELGGVLFSKTFADQMTDLTANDEAQQVLGGEDPRRHRRPGRRRAADPQRSSDRHQANLHRHQLLPDVQPAERDLISVRKTPIKSIDAAGINTTDAHYDLDAIVLATGFDAMTGALGKIDIVGRGGRAAPRRLGRRPAHLPRAGRRRVPEPVRHHRARAAPAVLANMVLARRGARRLDRRRHRLSRRARLRRQSRPRPDAVDNWLAECAQRAEATLFTKANSWYLGANVPGKPRVFMLFIGGFGVYNDICAEVAAAGYKGFELLKARLAALQEARARGSRRPPSARSSPSARSWGTHAVRHWGWCASGSATCPAG